MTRDKKLISLLIIIVIGLKITLFFFGYFVFDFDRYPYESAGSIWSRWDSRAYLAIADGGYSPENETADFRAFLSHFLPFYPAVIKFISDIFRPSYIYSGIIISALASLGSSYFLFRLVRSDFDTGTAFFSVLFMNVYPVSYFTLAVYSDSLFLFFTILFFYLMRKQEFFPAGLAGAGAMLTRITGLNLLPVCLFKIIQKRKELSWGKFIMPALIIAGFAAYLLINLIYFDNYRFFYDEKISFNRTKELIIPMKEAAVNLKLMAKDIPGSFDDNYFMFVKGYNSIFTFIAAIFIIIGILKKIPWDYTVYSLSSLLFFSSFSWGISNARYTLAIFPIFIVMAMINKAYIRYPMLAVSAFALFYFTKVFVTGGWAF